MEDLQPLSEQETEDLKLLLQRAIKHEQLMLFAQAPDDEGVETFSGNGVFGSHFSVYAGIASHERLKDPDEPLGAWEEYRIPEVLIGLSNQAIDALNGAQEFMGDVDLPEGISLTAKMVEDPCVQN